MADLAQTTVTVKGPKGDAFVFKIPSIRDEFRIGARVKSFCREADPTGDGSVQGLDWWTATLMQATATFEVLLEKTDATWPFTAGKDGKPVVDSNQFPSEVVEDVRAIYSSYMEEVSRFRSGGTPDGDADGAKAGAGQPDVQPPAVPG